MEKFGLILDFGRKRLAWTDTQWAEVRQKDAKGHYLLHLIENPDQLRRDLHKPEFSYLPDQISDNVHDIESQFKRNGGWIRT